MTAIAGVWRKAAPARHGAVTVDADARLDERDELARALGVVAGGVGSGDASLIRLAYLRWGDRCVERLLGDFAFVVRDGRTGRVLAARDPLGVKPFHYAFDTNRFVYATRIGDLFDLDRRLSRSIDEGRLADSLVPELEGIDATSTFYRGVQRLAPGHRIVVEKSRAAITRTWAPDPSRQIRFRSDAEYEDAFITVMREAVRCRMDPGTAAMLSGGLDSSAIVGFARAERCASAGPPLVTLSAVSADEVACEETRHVRAVIASGGISPLVVRLGDTAAFDAVVDEFVERSAEPFDATMILPLLMYSAARRAGARAVLDGVDGDIVASHEPDYLDSLLRGGAWRTAVHEARGLAGFYRGSYPPWSSPPRLLAASVYRTFVPAPLRRLRRPRRLAEVIRDSLLRPEFAVRVGLEDRLETLRARGFRGRVDHPRERQAAELAHPYIAAANERYHRVAASQGIEPRHPFLDRRLVELCLALPREQKVRDGWSKWIVRRATKGLLPESVRWRRGRWVRLGPAFLADAVISRRDRLEGALVAGERELEPYVDLAALRRTRARFASSSTIRDGELLWRMSQLACWLRRESASRYHAPAHDARASRVGAAAESPSIPVD